MCEYLYWSDDKGRTKQFAVTQKIMAKDSDRYMLFIKFEIV